MAVTIESVMSRLSSYGLVASVQEIDFALSNTIEKIKAYVNLDELPGALDDIVVERTCGALLGFSLCRKFTTGEDEAPVKSVKVGDTTVDLNTESARADALNSLCLYGQDTLDSYRRLRW